MTITTVGVATSVTPTVVKTYLSHYTNRKPRAQKPTAHISYDEGLNLVRAFLDFASHKTVEELQGFTAQWVPHPHWVKVDSATIPHEEISKAAELIVEQLGHHGIDKIGGSKWWQWRQKGAELKAEWIEMRGDYNARKKKNEKCTRVMMYIHGGAYFFGSVDEHRYQIQRHARKLKARVLAPRYRLAPQYPFPCGLSDCLATYLYLLTLQDPTEIILAGDSAGGGMVVSLMCILRDRGLPLPAGAILISPWVDLTHSFPSLAGDAKFDYIPAHGFMQKPSVSWPPPNEDEMKAVAEGAVKMLAKSALPQKSTEQEKAQAEEEAVKGFAVLQTDKDQDEQARQNPDNPADPNDDHADILPGNRIPGPGHQLSVEIDGKMVVLKDQIQMYATNQLISHPLVSPVLQPSLGGLPPILVMTGGGELLRDEQIFLAHKAANPEKYPLGDAYREEYDPDNTILHKYKPTPVQLQVWDDLCHVAPTLSFTRPAKFMYRSIAQFGAWALARAQKTSIEIQDDDSISIISSGSDTDSDTEERTDDLKSVPTAAASTSGKIGRAGDPLPPFRNHMIRQRVDRHGDVYPLTHDLPALQVPKNEIGVIKAGTVRKWMDAKQQWDGKYSRIKRKLQKQRIKELSAGGPLGFGAGESPPPSALAGRRKKDDIEVVKKNKKSMGLAVWSMWGSKHDEHTIEREEKAEEQEKDEPPEQTHDTNGNAAATTEAIAIESPSKPRTSSSRRRSSRKSSDAAVRERSRRRTITVIDAGQIEGSAIESDPETNDRSQLATPANETDLLSPAFVSKYKNLPSHLRNEHSGNVSSVATGTHTPSAGFDSLRNASSMAVFAAPGVLDSERPPAIRIDSDSGVTTPDIRSEVASTLRPDTPASRRSVERLQSMQDPDHDNFMHLANPSNVAVVGSEGVVREVVSAEDHRDQGEAKGENGLKVTRPGMYERGDSEFKTATEF